MKTFRKIFGKNGNKKLKVLASVLAAIIVFTTTYSLILPAITIDNETAQEEPGIEIMAEETEAAVEVTEAAVEEAVAEVVEAEPVAEPVVEEPVIEEPAAEEVPSIIEETAETAADEAADQTESESASETAAESQASSETTTAKAEETTAAAVKMPKVTFTEETNKNFADKNLPNIIVKVEAEEGTFPEGTTMKVKYVTDDNTVEAAVKDAVNKDSRVEGVVKTIHTVDIAFFNKEGKEIEPLKEIKVTFKSDTIKDIDKPVLVHIPDEGKGEAKVVDQLSAQEAAKAENEIIFKADEFSKYSITELVTGGVISADGVSYKVTVSYDEEAMIPSDAYLVISEIEDASEEYQSYLNEAKTALLEGSEAEISFARFFNITIMSDDEIVNPQAPVEIAIEYAEAQAITEDTQVSAIEFTDDTPNTLDVNINGTDDQMAGVSFEAEKLSEYGIVGTETLTTQVITAKGETYTIEVTYGPEAGIPKDAVLEAREILEGTEEYQKYIAQAQEAADKNKSTEEIIVDEGNSEVEKIAVKDDTDEKSGEIVSARFFDINIKIDGVIVEPKAPVQVSIKYDDAIELEENEQLKAIHFASNGTDLITVDDIVESKDGITEVSFTQDSFSVTGTVVQYLATGWPSDGNYVMVVRPYNSTNYYAVKDDGEITSVKVNENTGKVTFSDLTSVDQVEDYWWTITNLGSGWHYLTNGSNYLDPNEEDALSTNSDSVARNNGALYNYTYEGYSRVNNFMTVDENSLKIEGQGSQYADNRAIVLFANDFQVDEIPDPAEDPTEVDLGAPGTGKTITPNNDGTYQLALSVTGKSEASEKHSTADVLVVFDTSGSMGRNDMATAKSALRTLASALMNNNTEQYPDTVRMKLISFSTHVNLNLDWVTGSGTGSRFNNGYSTFNSNEIGALPDNGNGGTNWEDALETAGTIEMRSDAAKYVIFISDGNPTFHQNDGGYSNWNRTYQAYGTGGEQSTNVTRCYNMSRDDAKALVDGGSNLYNIGVGDPDRMKYLTAYAYSGNDSGSYPAGRYQAANASDLESVFANIINDINKNFSYTDVEIDDGITALTATALVTGTVNNYEYKISYVDAVDNQTHTVNATKNSDGTLTIPSVTYNIKNADGTTKSVTTTAVTVKGATYDGEKVTWELDKSDGTNYKLENGWTYEVSFTVWPTQRAYDLIADLANGNVTYSSLSDEEKASIDQATLTLKTNSEASVTYRQITTTNGVDGTPSDPKTVGIDNPPGVPLAGSDLKIVKRWNDDLDPTQLLDLLTDHLNAAGTDVDYTVTLDVVQDKGTSSEEHVHTADYPNGFVYKPNVTIEGGKVTAATWPEIDIAVAPGIMVTYEHAHAHGFDTAVDSDGNPKYRTIEFNGVTYYIIEEGHRYEITERAVDYHFEMMTDIDHLMIIDGVLKNVVHNDDGSIKEISQNPGNLTELGATNSLKGGINLYKYVEDSNGNKITPKDDVFTVKCKLVDEEGNAYTRSSETVGDDESDGIVYRVYAPDSELATLYPGKVETGRNRTIKIGVLNSSEFTVQLKAGWQIRFINVPSNTHWEFEEINIPTGYQLDTTGTEQVDGHTVPKTRGMTGIALTNTANDAQITNTMEDFETKILKIETGTGTKDSETGEYTTEPVKLDGVKFIVKNNNEGDDNGKYLVLTDDEISWSSTKSEAYEFTTANGGIVSFGSLPLGKYLLTETETKAGYNLLTEDISIEVTADGVNYQINSTAQPQKATKKTVTEDGKTVIYCQIEVPNSAGVTLPNTGGSGTLPYTLGGIALIIASALMYGFRMRRRERRLKE